MITDIHTHIYDDAALSDYMEKAEGRVSRLITYPFFTEDGQLRDITATIEFAHRHDNVFIVGTVDMNTNIEPQLASMRDLLEAKKIVGIKLYPGYQHFYPSDPIVDPVAKLCAEFGKPLIFHSGITHSEVKGTLLKYSHPEHVDEIAVRHPHTNFIICHFGFPYHLTTGTVLSDNDNVYSDISGILYGNNDTELAEIHTQNLHDIKRVMTYFSTTPDIRNKIMFGTDYIGGCGELSIIDPYISLVHELFDEKYHAHVFHDLAEHLFFSEK